MSNKSNRFSPEVRERAARMVQDHRGEYASQWAAIESIAVKIGCAAATLHEWIRKSDIDTGMKLWVLPFDLDDQVLIDSERTSLPIDVRVIADQRPSSGK